MPNLYCVVPFPMKNGKEVFLPGNYNSDEEAIAKTKELYPEANPEYIIIYRLEPLKISVVEDNWGCVIDGYQTVKGCKDGC